VELTAIEWLVVALCAAMVGMTKTGIPGFGILVVPLMASVFDAQASVGILLGILILADLFAAGYHRRNANWSYIGRLLPATFAGIVTGYFFLKDINDEMLKPIIGVIVLALLVLNWVREKYWGQEATFSKHWMFGIVMGFIAGVTTMMANAAGPVTIIYFLVVGLPKMEFVGTMAWFFFIVNWIKVPFSAKLGLMTAESVKLNLLMLPFIAGGAIVGILLLKHIPQKAFKLVVQILAAAAAIKLLL
jgi:hypothetical protein